MWHFRKEDYEDTISESKLDEFFSSSKCEAVVREAIQNSIDALPPSSSGQVKISFTFGATNRGSFDICYDTLANHWQTQERHIEIPEEIPYLLIEDFNTTGLEGILDKWGNEKKRKSLYSFWWEEGRSKKKTGSGGSHGVGKSTLSNASDFNTFLALSKRSENPENVLLGYCILPPHRLESEKFIGYARFGSSENAKKRLLPYADNIEEQKKILNQFRKHAMLKREDENGLSIFIPGIHKEINQQHVILAVIRNYFLPVIKGNLVVEVSDSQSGYTEEITKSSIINITKKYFENENDGSEIESLLNMSMEITQAIDKENYYYTAADCNFSQENTKLDKGCFTEGVLEKMQSDYQEGKLVPLKFNLPIHKKKEKVNGHFTVYLKNTIDKNKIYKAFRGNILIYKEKCRSSHAYSNIIIDVFNDNDENELSEYMKYTEDPGHGEWKNSAVSKSGYDYKRTEHWQKDFIRRSASSLLSILSGASEHDEISGFADDIFFIETDVEEEEPEKKTKSASTKDKGGDDDPDIPPIPKAKPKLFTVEKIDDAGFRIKGTRHLKELMEKPDNTTVEATLKAAYIMPGVSKTKWFKSYIPADFDFGDMPEKTEESISLTLAEKNRMTFTVNESDFRLEVKGFDPNRDLHINVQEVNGDE